MSTLKKKTRLNNLSTLDSKLLFNYAEVKTKKKGEAIGICTKSVINRKGFKRGKFSCKRKPSIQLYKGGKRRKKTRKKRGGTTLKEIEDRINVLRKALTYWSNVSDNHPSILDERIFKIFKIRSELEELLPLREKLLSLKEEGRDEGEEEEEGRDEPNLKKHGGRRTRKKKTRKRRRK